MPAQPKPGETARPMNSKEIQDKVEQDIRFASEAAIRVAKTAIRIAIEPKINTFKRLLRAVFEEER